MHVNARIRTETDLNESEINLNESEIDLNECEHFLKRTWINLRPIHIGNIELSTNGPLSVLYVIIIIMSNYNNL